MEEEYVEEGEKLERDGKSNFSKFSGATECGAILLIRTASEVVGPRGDERSGCREESLAFCSLKGVKSLFSSYRSNRFNNFFQNASALLLLRKILSFSSESMYLTQILSFNQLLRTYKIRE